MKRLLLAIALLYGCARYTNVDPRPIPSADVMVADYVTHFNSSYEWEHSEWYRVGDPYETTGFFVVSAVGSICLSRDGTWVTSRHGEPYECHGGWRNRSHSGGTRGSRVL